MLRALLHQRQVSGLRNWFISTHRLIIVKYSPSFCEIIISSIRIHLAQPFGHSPGHFIAFEVELSLKFFNTEM